MLPWDEAHFLKDFCSRKFPIGRDTELSGHWAGHWTLELETKVAEDYTKFYNQPLLGPSPGPFTFKTLLRHYAKRTLPC